MKKHVKMPNENNKILKYNPGEKSLKVPSIIYADLECLLEKIDTCQNNPKNSYTEKKAKHKPSGFKNLRDQAMKIINHKKNERNNTN